LVACFYKIPLTNLQFKDDVYRWVGWGKHCAGKNKAYRFQTCGGSRANAMTERNGANRVGGLEWHEQFA